uniref:TVP38/TMEM64 family membrane protein n=1 Tax=Neobodo designis TaxID=312471 RepID=A0A7S1R358_NEODS|mmetsp:Transcript_7601/g.23716  ORF Transcript_7601/g.23716 Transcript_7601/m.23716 type:complete len:227 (+) Transcript_7601:49-729(+)
MQTWAKAAAVAGILVVLSFACYRFVDHVVKHDPDRIRDAGPVVLAAACFISGFPVPTLFTAAALASGFSLGLAGGIAVAVPSTLLGMIACFEVARRWMKDTAQQWVTRYTPDLANVASKYPRAGIVAVRLLPVPFSFQNLFWASCTDAPRLDFVACSSVIVAPHVSLLVYLGASSKSLADALARKPSAAFPVALTLCTAAVLLAVALRYVRRTILSPQTDPEKSEV